MANRRINIGDCFEIPLPDGKLAYCQYLAWHEEMGYLVRIFDRIELEPVASVEELHNAKELFPPVFVALRIGIKKRSWRFVGSLSVKSFEFPRFRSTNGVGPGVQSDWSLWDGKNHTHIGSLPEELRSLEMDVVWGDEALVERIATGVIPFAGVI